MILDLTKAVTNQIISSSRFDPALRKSIEAMLADDLTANTMTSASPVKSLNLSHSEKGGSGTQCPFFSRCS